MRRPPVGPRHMFMPDSQVRPGVPTEHLEWAAKYIAAKRPDVIVNAGDFWDMPSLSSYDRGKRSAEGRRYKDDIDAGARALELFERTLKRYAGRGYRPRKVALCGNHEERICRAADEDPRSNYTLDDLTWKKWGWEFSPFLQPVVIDGIAYAHYFPIGPQGRVVNSKNGAPTAKAQVSRMMQSCVAGHRQGLDVAIVHTPTRTYRGIQAGSFYRHPESYLTPMGDNYWRGLICLQDVRDGEFGLMEVDMSYLERRFG